ncbi:hypothetical protein P7L75_09480 [Tistrella mobilis]|uniref:hypothetical protein n=1 Tax=Tistrella mobilis TaxID=171437 RepID=UPI00355741E7
MSLSSYARHARNDGWELRAMLHDEAYEPLLAGLSQDSVLKLSEFRRVEDDLVEQVATAQPAKRRKILEKLPLEKRFWTIAAAAQMAFEAAEILSAVDIELRPGGSYRDMVGSVQRVLDAPYLNDDYLWPFPGFRPS